MRTACVPPELGIYPAKIDQHHPSAADSRPEYNKHGTLETSTEARTQEVKFSFIRN
jgi:hypothetical protein